MWSLQCERHFMKVVPLLVNTESKVVNQILTANTVIENSWKQTLFTILHWVDNTLLNLITWNFWKRLVEPSKGLNQLWQSGSSWKSALPVFPSKAPLPFPFHSSYIFKAFSEHFLPEIWLFCPHSYRVPLLAQSLISIHGYLLITVWTRKHKKSKINRSNVN